MHDPTLDIQTFTNLQELRDGIPHFLDDNPISKMNYKRLIGDYRFDDEVCCCFMKDNGNLCGESHKRGWVAELIDGSATIIGNKCAQDKFGADSRLIADSRRYANEKRRRARLAALQRQIDEKDQRLATLAQARADLESLERRIHDITSQFGSGLQKRLQDMVRDRTTNVIVTAVRYREGTDERGNPTRERSAFLQTLGSLAGLDLASRSTFLQVYYAIDDVRRAYQEVKALGEKPKAAAIEALATRLNAYDQLLRKTQELLTLERAFMDNNFLLLCYVEREKSERFKAAKFAMHHAGIDGGKDDAKAWLAEQDKAIRLRLGVDAIDIR